MKLIRSAFLICLITSFLSGQEVRNTSYATSTGEKVLRLELVIPADKKEVWRLFSTAEGWKKWAAPVVSMDFKTGGQILTHYDKSKTVADPGTIRLRILNYLEGEMITLRVKLTESFPPQVRQEDENLQEIIQFVDLGKGKTKIISSMIGWGKGADWDKAYEFFARGNEWTFKELKKLFH